MGNTAAIHRNMKTPEKHQAGIVHTHLTPHPYTTTRKLQILQVFSRLTGPTGEVASSLETPPELTSLSKDMKS